MIVFEFNGKPIDMKLLKEYFELQQRIYEYFGYREDWVTIPLRDETDFHWAIMENFNGSGRVIYSPNPFTKENIEEGSTLYSGSIYTQRHLPKWVYRGKEYTMICVDTHCDGNKFLMVLDNKLECTDKELKLLYCERWGSV